ncbi:hypothetical protein BC833DRAFT_589458 [Globomyces pollinis-pini]|nr:hypothetical protein BC833DRAFT_589458 [Globomyces pollinis-pini]
MMELAVWSMFILSSVYGQGDQMSATVTGQLNTINGRNWSSKEAVDTVNDWIPYSSVVEVGNYTVNTDDCRFSGSIAMENIDVTFEFLNSPTVWDRIFNKWKNSTTPIIDEEVNLALEDAFSMFFLGVRLISLTVDSAKPSGTPFDTFVFFNNVRYSTRWLNEFGGTFSDTFNETILSLDKQNKQRLINFTKVTRVELVGQTVRIIADKALLTARGSSIKLPFISASITKGSLKLEGSKLVEKPFKTSTNTSWVIPFNTGSDVKYWPSVGTSEKKDISSTTFFESDVFNKTFVSSSISVPKNNPYEFKDNGVYLYGTASFEQIDMTIYSLDERYQTSSWYRILKYWGKSPKITITDEEVSMAMDSVFSGHVELRNISAESITGIGNGFESLCALPRLSDVQKFLWGEGTAYAQKWKGTFGGSFLTYPNTNATLLLRPIAQQRILNFSNVTKVEQNGGRIRVVAAKAVLSLGFSELKSCTGIAKINSGTLTLEGFVSQSGFFIENPILSLFAIGGTIAVLYLVIFIGVREIKKRRKYKK